MTCVTWLQMRRGTTIALGILLGSVASTAAQDLRFSEGAARESIQSMARTGGAWVTSNARYRSPASTEPKEYLMSIRSDANGLAVTGCMWGRTGTNATPRIWTFMHAWDPAEGAILAYHASPSGAVAVGHERPLQGGGTETIQTLTGPQGTSARVRHLNRLTHADTVESQSFSAHGGTEWSPARSYTWTWAHYVEHIPCLVDHTNAPFDGRGRNPEAMDALGQYVGEWRAEDRTTPDGGVFHFEYRLEWFDQAQTIVQVTITQVFDAGREQLLWSGFKGLDRQTGSVYYHGFSPGGRVARGSVYVEGDDLITQYVGWGTEGPTVEIRDTFTPVEGEGFVSVTEMLRDGSWTEVGRDHWR